MPKLSELTEGMRPPDEAKRRAAAASHAARRQQEFVEQVPISADDYDIALREAGLQPVPGGNGHGEVRIVEREVPFKVEVPVLPPKDPRDRFIARVWQQVGDLLETSDQPVPSRSAVGTLLQSFLQADRAGEKKESDRLLVHLAAAVIVYAARRLEDRTRYFEPSGKKPF